MAGQVSDSRGMRAESGAPRAAVMPVRLSAMASVTLITVLSLGGWALIGGLIYWVAR